MRTTSALILLSVMPALAGCIPSQPLKEGELTNLLLLTDDPLAHTERIRPTIGTLELPGRWVLRRGEEPKDLSVHLRRQIEAKAEELSLSMDDARAESIRQTLATIRGVLEDLRKMLDSERDRTPEKWAKGMGLRLAELEYLSRRVHPDQSTEAEPPASPLLQAMALFLNEQSEENMLGDLTGEDAAGLRSMVTGIALRLGFAVLGRSVPKGLGKEVQATMKQAKTFQGLPDDLAKLLRRRAADAPPAAEGDQLASAVSAFLKGAPKTLEAMEKLLAQWNRMDYVSLELRRGPAGVVAVLGVAVSPGKEVRLEDLVVLQPILAFRGTSRVIVVPHNPATNEVAVLFDYDESGGVELRFEGIVYSLARLFAFPLASGKLREIRVSRQSRLRGRNTMHVTLAMEATGDRDDPRRLLIVQDARTTAIQRRAFRLEHTSSDSDTIVHYLTPGRRYTYRRQKP